MPKGINGLAVQGSMRFAVVFFSRKAKSEYPDNDYAGVTN